MPPDEYKDIRVSQGDKVLYASDFSQDAPRWRFLEGQWDVADGALRQSAPGTNLRAVFGDSAWRDYTVSLKARKISGSEGFLLMFDVQNDNRWFWWNVGGWGNVRHGLE